MKNTLKNAFITLFSFILLYLVWINMGKTTHLTQSLKIDVSESYGDSTQKANILGVQAFMEPIDYASEENFKRKIQFYLEQAHQKHFLIENKTVVVFPEYIGTFLVATNEKNSLYEAKTLQEGLQTMVFSNIGQFLKTYLTTPKEVKDKIKYAAFAMKAQEMAKIYQNVFAELSKKYKVTIVAGSILLPNPSVEDGILKVNDGLLFNTSMVFDNNGKLNSNLIKKAFPTADELSFVCSAKPEETPIFETPIGKMGVLVCADAWFSASYKVLKGKGVDFIVTPSYSNGYGNWNKKWTGYSGAETPADAKASIGKLTLGDAWVKHAMAERAKTEAGVKKGLNVFLQGNIWDLGADGSTIILNDSAKATSHIGKAALVNLWL
ncbi:carbon-nitrogen hydrolase family protein [Emticicia sp. SJ17W-69]|uniref:carbon-nitrogen hydrolase family protein n=1 Tax=Emticicia sp. SJ17W-69 TaxID=3421657 RepID=UPI003EBDDCE8